MLKLISATPSPYARKVRISLAEKGIPFELVTEVPWDSTTKTPMYNPLEKLPVLIVSSEFLTSSLATNGATTGNNDKGTAVYESHYILEWLEAKCGAPRYRALLPSDIDERLYAKQVEVVADGVCDALVLRFFERMRDEDKQSKEWTARQMRKIDGGIKWLAEQIGDREFMIGTNLTNADIAACSVLGYIDVRFKEYRWRDRHPNLASYNDKLQQRKSFKDTVPYAQTMKDKVI